MKHSISIAMATYNGGHYLRDQFDSILDQTVSFTELIVCDDASTDDSWSILQEYAAKDSRVRIFRNEQKLGFLRNFEKALGLSTCDYIALSDQDDIWTQDHLEKLLKGIEDKLVVVGDAEIMTAESHRTGIKLSYCSNLEYVPRSDLQKAYFMFYRNPYHGMAMMFRREFLNMAMPIPNEIRIHDIWFSSLACFYGGLSVIDETVTLYRRHQNNVTETKNKKTRFRSFIGHILFNRSLFDFVVLPDLIRERLGNKLTDIQLNFLREAENYYYRRKSVWGRFYNMIFEIKHFKSIYGYK